MRAFSVPRPPFPLRAIARTVRDDWVAHYHRARQPARVRLAGIELELGEWATPFIREGIYEGWYEQQERRILETTVLPGDRILELGAGAGFVTARACQLVGGKNVLAFEADPRMAAVARATLARNDLDATVLNTAVGQQDGDATFYVHDAFWLYESRTGSERETSADRHSRTH